MQWRWVVLALVVACGKSKSGGAGSAAPEPVAPGSAASANSAAPVAIGCKPGPRPPIGFLIEKETPLPDGRAINKLGRLGDGRLVALSEDGQKRNALFVRDGATWSEIALPPVMENRKIWIEITSTSIVITASAGSREKDEPPNIWSWQASTRQWSDAGVALDRGSAIGLRDGRLLVLRGPSRRVGQYRMQKGSAQAPAGSGQVIVAEPPPGSVRDRYELTTLRDGRVLMTIEDELAAHLWNPADGTWTPTGSLARPRHWYTTTELPDGRVLLIGGEHDDRGVLEIEEWSPATGKWRDVGRTSEPRTQHTATALTDCRVVITGGFVPAVSNETSPEALTTEVWNPVDNTMEDSQLAAATRIGHQVLAEADGTLLVAVGDLHGSMRGPAPDFERWRPVARPPSRLAIESLEWPYLCQPLVPLSGGDIVLVGANMRWLRSTNTLARVTAPPVPLSNVAVALSDDSVLALSRDQRSLWRLTKNTWSAAGKLKIPEQEETRLFPDAELPFTFTITALPAGKAFIAGGDADQVWNHNKLTPVSLVSEWRRGHTATLLATGEVMIIGGVFRTEFGGPSNPPAKVTPVYWPETKETGTTDQPFEGAMENQSSIRLTDDNVLVTGGDTAHIYDAKTGAFRPVGKLAVARKSPTLVRLPDGRVVALGGEAEGTQPLVEVFDPASATWSTLGALPEIWTSPSAVVLGPDRIAVAAEGRAIVLVLK